MKVTGKIDNCAIFGGIRKKTHTFTSGYDVKSHDFNFETQENFADTQMTVNEFRNGTGCQVEIFRHNILRNVLPTSGYNVKSHDFRFESQELFANAK